MSSIASFHLVKSDDLPAIVRAAGSARACEAIHQFGTELDEEFGWSGYVMLNVLVNLRALNMPMGRPGLRAAAEAINGDYDFTTLIASDAKAFLDRLDLASFQVGDLLDGPIALGFDDEEARYALEETLALLRDTTARLSDDQVLLVHVG